ncbi:NAD(P)-dependent oxidoreductase [Pectobacterium punjabense]|uniref:NAD(P)-dependent oxidoreductase n=1 Tax=Pectobacterium punjabense TaxID=2108399 RepID=A0ABX6L3C8_9GAMM|nr:NAD(P)-dependent oxidoreductase [Pectobacterium punjabense]MBN3137858.1 NAD(P)-dependent oxidoreductase [Pectobacterium punjabense]MBS4431581.1 NAD(P)-dependent oxidoreductase [Pectobacterium punjabense]MCE5379757.1 NAD(P)-dependent oxidoreductase [Pectobacterium punjabense]PTA66303.1 NAD-dependent epimerase/dehydratase [Pectobacterium punjabense]QJA20848.1 NAD(P)-dependent oxidoreductase [Pectobacterium punjabense]
MKRILITGATGFVGKHILNALEKEEVSVRVISRSGENGLLSTHSNVDEVIVTHDLFNESETWWCEVAKGIDIVIHVAWYVEPGKYLSAMENIDCLKGTLVMARGCAQAGIKRFIGIGTCFEYDASFCMLSTETPLKPNTLYSDSKAAVFFALSNLLPIFKVEFAWCRLFYLFGEGENEHRFVPYLRKQLLKGEKALLSSGNQIRDFLDVTIAASKIIDTALGSKTGAVNICSGIPLTIKQLAEKIADEYNGRKLLNFGARPDNLMDPPCIVGVP